MSHQIFISYSVKDKHFADALCHRLEDENFRCWIAPRDISPGGNWAGEIANAIPGAQTMILIFTANSNNSKQVLREVELAIANDIVIIPLKVEEVTPTGGMSYFLSTTHWIDAVGDKFDQRIDLLIRKIKRMLDDGTGSAKHVSESEKENTEPEEKTKAAAAPVSEKSTIDNNTEKKGNSKKKIWPYVIAGVSLIAVISMGLYIIFGLLNDGKKDSAEESPKVTEWDTLEKGTDYYANFRPNATSSADNDTGQNPTPSVIPDEQVLPEQTPESTPVSTPLATAETTQEATAAPAQTTEATQSPAPTPTPEATQSPAPTPAPQKLSIANWEDDVFVSEWADVRFQLPTGWYKASEEEILLLYEITESIIAGAAGLDTDSLEEADYIYPMMILKYPIGTQTEEINTNMIVCFEKLYPPNDILVNAEAYLRIVWEQYEEMEFGFDLLGDIDSMQIAGKTYKSMVLTHNSAGMRQVMICRKIDNFIISFVITAAIDGQAEVEMLIDSIEGY